MLVCLKKENIMNILKNSLCVTCIFAFVQSIMSIVPIHVLCDDLFDVAGSTISNAQKELVDICLAACPLSIIVILLSLIFVRDERKMAWLIKLAGTVVVATALVLVVNSDVLVSTLKTWFEAK